MQFDLLRMRKTPFFCAVLFCLISSDAVIAAEWSIEPSISLREEYNDNIRFTTSPHPGVWQTTLSPSVKLSSKTEVSEVSGLAQINFNRFTGEQGLNQNDQVFSLLTSLQSERNIWAMNASYKQDSTSESELIATGIVQVRTQRTASSLNPSWTRTLTERSSLRLDYNYQDVKYGSHINLTDYTHQQVNSSLQYQLSERDQVSLAATYSITDYAPNPRTYTSSSTYTQAGGFSFNPAVTLYGSVIDTQIQKYNTPGIQANAMHMFSETLKGDFLVGFRTAISDISHSCNGVSNAITGILNCTGSPLYFNNLGTLSPIANVPMIAYTDKTRSHGYTFSANLEKTFDTAKVSGFASRETNASGGGLIETDKIGMSFNKSLTEAVTGYVDAISYHTKYISLASPSSRYYTFEPKLNWRFTEWWTLDAGYRYARYEPDSVANATTVANAITSNAVYLNLTYNWPKMAVSR